LFSSSGNAGIPSFYPFFTHPMTIDEDAGGDSSNNTKNMVVAPASPAQPGLPTRMATSLTMGLVGSLSRMFLYGLSSVEVTGLERFLDILDKRRDVEGRQRGLLTGSIYIHHYLFGA
jgi:hypothetical protein